MNVKLFILITILLTFGIVLLIIRFAFSPTETPIDKTIPIATPRPTQTISIPAQITPSTAPIAYNPEDLERDFQRIQNKKALSDKDAEIRQQLIQSLGDKSGILINNNVFQIEYVKSADRFMGEIKTSDTEPAKTETLNWFKQQGLSNEGICNLPVILYLNAEIARQLESNGQKFDPNIEGC